MTRTATLRRDALAEEKKRSQQELKKNAELKGVERQRPRRSRRNARPLAAKGLRRRYSRRSAMPASWRAMRRFDGDRELDASHTAIMAERLRAVVRPKTDEGAETERQGCRGLSRSKRTLRRLAEEKKRTQQEPKKEHEYKKALENVKRSRRSRRMRDLCRRERFEKRYSRR